MIISNFCQDDQLKTITKEYDEGAKWSEVLTDYVEFLSFCYGYDIKPYVSDAFEQWSE